MTDRLAAQFVESLANYILGIFGEVQRGQFFAGKPADFGGVIGGLQFSSHAAAEEVDQYIVILDALFGIAEDAVVDAEQFAGLDDESGLFAGLADGGLADQFADFEDASGNGPMILEGWAGAPDQEDASVLDDDGADADERDFGELAFHAASILSEWRVRVTADDGADLARRTGEWARPHTGPSHTYTLPHASFPTVGPRRCG
jgi:hypothetical protein